MNPMKNLITRLFADAENATAKDPLTQSLRTAMVSSMECQLMLKSGYALAGVLTTTPEGALQLVAVASDPGGEKVLVDYYFAYEDVMTIVVARVSPQKLFTPGRSNGSIIIPGH